MPENQFLTAAEAADLLNLSERTIRRLITDGTLPAVRIGRTVRISRTDLTDLASAAIATPVPVSARKK